ncbi:MAG: type IV toxin-antitoxin system AbiEi family antitoxin domain-containing protein [Nocardioides sp.]
MTYRQELWEIAAANHGVVTTRQAEEVGVPAEQLRILAARGALTRLAYGVYRHNGVPLDSRTELAAALAAAGPDAFLEGDTVLAMHGLALVNPNKIHVGTARPRRNTPPRNTVVRARPNVDERELTSYDGLRAVTVRQALIDAADHVPVERLLAAVGEAENQELLDELEATEVRGVLASRTRHVTAAAR